MKDLTPKQRRFIELYTNVENKETFNNATQSYLQAGFKAKNPNSAGVMGYRLLRNVNVKSYLEGKMKEFELSINQYLSDLDKKLKEGGKSLTIDREWLKGVRTALECAGKLNPKPEVTVNTAIFSREMDELQKKRLGKAYTPERTLPLMDAEEETV